MFVAIERHSKLVLNIAMGKRDQGTTDALIEGVRHATITSTKFQITTDGFAPYRAAITTTLHDRITGFAQLIKVYRAASEREGRYSLASVEVVPVMGQPDPERICNSIIERSNLSTRMSLRRFTRLTYGFSKKWENHWAAVVVWYCWYNFGRVHKSLPSRLPWKQGLRITRGACVNFWRQPDSPWSIPLMAQGALKRSTNF